MPTLLGMSTLRSYPPEAKPVVHVLHNDGCWYLGRLCAWQWYDEAWHAVVEYTVRSGCQLYLDVPATDVRQPGPGLHALDGSRLTGEPPGVPSWP